MLKMSDDFRINSFNEWDPLKRVIVGRVDGACVPQYDIMVKVNTYPKNRKFFADNGGRPFPKDAIEKAREELENFVRVLESEGVKVDRPAILDYSQKFLTPDFSANGMYAVMPRDILVTIGDQVIEAPMAWRSRFFEWRAYRRLATSYIMKGGKWVCAPKSQMSDELYDKEYPMVTLEDRHKLAEEGRFATTEFEPCFDAADMIRCGRDIFIQRSQVTNKVGIQWLKNYLGKDFRVHVIKFKDPNPMHIDATFLPLRKGLILANPDRPCQNLDIFERAGWQVIYAPSPTLPDDWFLPMSSKWLSMNLLVLNSNTIIAEEHEEPTIKLLESLGFRVIKVPFRHVYSFGGSFHCVTCDVEREGILEDYGFVMN
jgi:glycine amidinotransferase